MQIVDHICVDMVRATLSQMRMVWGQVRVVVRQVGCIRHRPHPQHGNQPKAPDRRQDQSRDTQPCARADPTRQRISHQPAGMGEGKLGGKDRGTVSLTG